MAALTDHFGDPIHGLIAMKGEQNRADGGGVGRVLNGPLKAYATVLHGGGFTISLPKLYHFSGLNPAHTRSPGNGDAQT